MEREPHRPIGQARSWLSFMFDVIDALNAVDADEAWDKLAALSCWERGLTARQAANELIERRR